MNQGVWCLLRRALGDENISVVATGSEEAVDLVAVNPLGGLAAQYLDANGDVSSKVVAFQGLLDDSFSPSSTRLCCRKWTCWFLHR